MAEQENYKTLIVHSAKYQTLYTRKYENRRKWVTPNFNQVYSFIPGTVLDVFVQEGQQLKEGDPLMILDAMKMHNTVMMPFDGTIKKVYVEKSAKIPKNFLMFEIEP